MTKLIVTTFARGLFNIVDTDNGSIETRPKSNAEQPYGITWDEDYLYVQHGKSVLIFDKQFNPADRIDSLPPHIHQIQRIGPEELWITSPSTDSLLVYNLKTKISSHFDPTQARFGRPKQTDINHFNSIHLTENTIYIAAHCHKNPSYIIGFDKHTLEKTYFQSIGSQIHNIFETNGKIYTLDSGKTKSIISKNEKYELGLGPQDFVRGFAASQSHYFVGTFREGKFRISRYSGDGTIKIVNRNTMKIEKEITIKDSGDICDIRILSEPDLTHGGSTFIKSASSIVPIRFL